MPSVYVEFVFHHSAKSQVGVSLILDVFVSFSLYLHSKLIQSIDNPTI